MKTPGRGGGVRKTYKLKKNQKDYCQFDCFYLYNSNGYEEITALQYTLIKTITQKF